jgi:hypothetical protein
VACWPQSFRLRRGDREVVFSLEPFAGDAYITLYVAGEEVVSIGRIRRLETLSVVKRDGYEGLEPRFADARLNPMNPMSLQTRPEIRLS